MEGDIILRKILIFLVFILVVALKKNEVEIKKPPDKKIIEVNYSREYLISDEDYRYMDYNLEETVKFFKSFHRNRFSRYTIKRVFYWSKKNNLSIIVVAAKIEQESSLVTNCIRSSSNYYVRRNRLMGVGLYIKKINPKTGKKYCPYYGFETQIRIGCRILNNYQKSWIPKKKIKLIQGQGTITPKNAATYALYVYCPVYGRYNNYGTICIGNRLFPGIYKGFKERWFNIIKKNN